MRTPFRNACALVFAILAAVPGCAGPGATASKAKAKPHESLTIPPLRSFAPPQPQRHLLDNGMVVFLLEDHTLPVIDLAGLVRAGSVHETADKAGLASLCGEVMRTGGSEKHPGDLLDERLASIGGSIGVSFDLEWGSFSLGTLAEDFDAHLPVLVDVLQHPAFPEEKIALAKTGMLTAIAQRNDDPQEIARRLFPQLLYGPDSPYARQEETWTVEAITRQDLLDFHQRFIAPNAMIVGVHGDFDATHMLARIREAFSGWPQRSGALPPAPQVRPEPLRTVNLAAKEDLNQSTVMVGHLGTVRRADDPDYFALVVANDILGSGGFSSRLLQQVRTREGLAYSIGSRFGADYTHPGLFTAGCQTKSGATVQAIESIRREIRRMTEAPVTEEELRIAKESIGNSLVFEYDTRGEIVARAMRYELHGFPSDYIERFQKGVAAVTVDDVLAVCRKYLRPDNLTVLAVGNPAQFDKPLASLGMGPVAQVPLAPARPASAEETPSPEALAAGRKVMEEAAAAFGGLKRLEEINTLTIKGRMTVEAAPGMTVPIDMTIAIRYPDRIRIDMKTPQGEISQGFDGKSAWACPPGMPPMDLPASQAQEMKSEIQKLEMRLVAACAQGALPAWRVGEEAIDGKIADEVRVKTPSGMVARLYFDRATRRLVKTVQSGSQGTEETFFSDHRSVQGLLFPFHRTVTGAGTTPREMTMEKVTVNSPIPDGAFTKPAAPGK